MKVVGLVAAIYMDTNRESVSGSCKSSSAPKSVDHVTPGKYILTASKCNGCVRCFIARKECHRYWMINYRGYKANIGVKGVMKCMVVEWHCLLWRKQCRDKSVMNKLDPGTT